MAGEIGIGLAGDFDGAASLLDDGLRDGQAEAGAACGAGTGRIAAIKPIEDVGQRIDSDSLAAVLDDEDGGLGLPGEAEFDGGLGRAVLEGVEEQVGDEEGAVFRWERDEGFKGHSLRGQSPLLVLLLLRHD